MARNRMASFLAIALLLALGLGATRAQANMKGLCVQADRMSASDYSTLKDVGVDIVRLDFSRVNLMDRWDFSWNEANWDLLHDNLSWAKDNDIKVVVDPHAMPGCERPWTMLGSDRIWKNPVYKDALLMLWERLANECAAYGDTIWAYDLMNEPCSENWIGKNGGTITATDIYEELVPAVRANDNNTPIMLEFEKWDWNLSVVPAPSHFGGDSGNSKIYYSLHMYEPMAYSHQGRDGRALGQVWPDSSQNWTKNQLMTTGMAGLKAAKQFSDTHGSWRFFIGEFGARYDVDGAWNLNDPNRNPPANGGDNYYNDQIDIYNDWNWSWTIFGYKCSQDYDVTQPNPRWNLVRSYFSGSGAATKPAAPSSCSGSRLSDTSAKITWTDNSNNESEFIIQSKLSWETVWRAVATVDANTTQYTETGLVHNGSYEFRVKAKNSKGASAWSPESSGINL